MITITPLYAGLIALILLVLAEFQGAPTWVLHLLGIT